MRRGSAIGWLTCLTTMGLWGPTSSAFAASTTTAKPGVMAMVGLGLIVLGTLITLAASIWMIVRAFRVNLVWGLCCLLIPGALLVFLLAHARRVGQPLLLILIGILATGVGWRYTGQSLPKSFTRDQIQPMFEAGIEKLHSLKRTPRTGAAKIKRPNPPVGNTTRALGNKPAATVANIRIGDALDATVANLPTPKGRMVMGQTTAIQYEGFRLISDDGATITDIVHDGADIPIQRVKQESASTESAN